MTKTILITGATDGIGLALAHLYQRQNARLILVGRRPLAELDPALFTAQTYVQSDLSEDGASAQINAFLNAHNLHTLDLVIHNAGLGYVGHPAAQPAHNIASLVAVNLQTPILLTQLLLPYLRRAGGKLVFVSSVAVAMGTPDYAVYTATKAALDGFARNLAIELRDEIPILVVHPGATQTGMHRKSGADLAKLKWSQFPSAEVVATQIVDAIAGHKRQSTLGLGNRLLWRIGQLLGLWLDKIQIQMGR